MRLFRNAVVAVLGGLLLAASLPTGSAAAQDGGFAWLGPKGKPYFVQQLPPNKCMSMEQEARGARNYLSKPLVVYSEKNCKGKALRLGPHKEAPQTAPFKSLKYDPR
ncbi:hypothetical protein [Streptomyces griseocarneus]|uniref:hypothetical protein n=1 Tax=Streptomyces griseocarneus TaxID=51201 RepID=UPI0019913891|nr:hypothetical protein [Streptomyces griseocarneus]MBZ6474783.1 hypothetical protein [Streptomyces griseocarneus]GHG48057.1 hypothetical protein GCM10018779_06000 [Streptomyces griseocarneus]